MMTTPIASDYARAYAQGRHAAKERVPAKQNPHHPGTRAFRAWNDGHYDEQSARHIAIERHSAMLWSDGDAGELKMESRG
jgi:hypothetical protein